MDSNRKIEAIDLFCGIGGLSYGLKQACIKIKAGLDIDESCKYTYQKNIGADFIAADIVNYDLSELHKYYSKDSIKALVGCAPCQPFSSHSYKNKKKRKDNRWNLIQYFIKAVEELKPDIISMENVRGIVNTNVFKEFANDLEKLGYYTEYKVVFCPDYGIPQSRHRLVLIGSNKGKIIFPKETHTKERYKTVRQTIGHLSFLSSGDTDSKDYIHKAKNLAPLNIKRIKQSRPGGTWKDWDKKLLPDCYTKKSGQTYTSVYGRMKWDQPSPTITTQFFNYGSGRFGHPEQHRALSPREGALLQTFPENYDFGVVNSLQKLGMHIGNAVPPKLGEIIGWSIMNKETNHG